MENAAKKKTILTDLKQCIRYEMTDSPPHEQRFGEAVNHGQRFKMAS
jgi:hypothetical protein